MLSLLPDVLLHLQLPRHLRHRALIDVHNDNPKPLMDCFPMLGAVDLKGYNG